VLLIGALRRSALSPNQSQRWASSRLPSRGRNGDAEPLHRRALEIREWAFQPDHPDISDSIIYLADVYRARHRIDDAMSLHAHWIAIREKDAGLAPDDARRGKILNDLGDRLREFNHNEEAATVLPARASRQ
jgi:Tetratricopeptide repeat